MSIITRKIEVYIAEADKEQQKAFRDTIYEWSRQIYKASNVAMGVRFEMLGVCQTLECINEEKRVFVEDIMKKERGNSKQNVAYRVLTSMLKGKMPSAIYSSLAQLITKKFNDMELKIRRGDVSVPSYKYGMPIPFPVKSVADLHKDEEDGKYYFTLHGIPFCCRLGRDRSNNAAIIDGVLDGRYKMSTSSIKVDGKDMYLLLCVNIPDKKAELDPKTVVGLDLGINVPIYGAVNNDKNVHCPIGNREQFLNQKTHFIKRGRALQCSVKDAKGGKGRIHKLKALDRLKKAERNWTKTMNHTYSHQAVEFAVKQGAGVIQMEDLSGFGKLRNGKADKTREFLLRNWCYFELQQMIEYKAKQYGIKVRYVEPAYTTLRCSECGEIGIVEEKDKTKYHCQNPECSLYRKPFVHADWNGARNISMSTEYTKKNKSTDED